MWVWFKGNTVLRLGIILAVLCIQFCWPCKAQCAQTLSVRYCATEWTTIIILYIKQGLFQFVCTLTAEMMTKAQKSNVTHDYLKILGGICLGIVCLSSPLSSRLPNLTFLHPSSKLYHNCWCQWNILLISVHLSKSPLILNLTLSAPSVKRVWIQ